MLSEFKNAPGTTLLRMGQECYYVNYKDYTSADELMKSLGMNVPLENAPIDEIEKYLQEYDEKSNEFETKAKTIYKNHAGKPDISYPTFVLVENGTGKVIAAILIEHGLMNSEMIGCVVENKGITDDQRLIMLRAFIEYHTNNKIISMAKTMTREMANIFSSSGDFYFVGLMSTETGKTFYVLERVDHREKCKV